MSHESGRVKGSFSFNSFKEDYEDEKPSTNYPQKLTTQRQKSYESHLSSTLMRVKLVYHRFIFSPCSGLVVSGYSKTQTYESFNTSIAPALEPYKKYKKMFIVDNSGDFKGIQI